MLYYSAIKKFSDKFVLKIEKNVDNLRLISPFEKDFLSIKKFLYINYVLYIQKVYFIKIKNFELNKFFYKNIKYIK